MRAVDTNVLVRLLARDDAAQAAAADRFVAEGAWVSHLVLGETTCVLTAVYRMDAARVARAVAMLLAHERLVLDRPDVVGDALDDFRAHPAVGFSDCLVLATARAAGHLPLGTFDRRLARLEGAARVG
jgi:predicted nucleic-acid-binding protein